MTEVETLQRFWPAEPAHQDCYARNSWAGYCQMVVAPKVAKFRKQFTDRLRTPMPATA